MTAGPHAWNTVTIKGVTYFVDVTYDHRDFVTGDLKRHDHVYFNAPREIISSTHSCDRDFSTGLNTAGKVDADFFYTASEYDAAEELFGFYYSSAKKCFQAIAKHIPMGSRLLFRSCQNRSAICSYLKS